MREENEVSVLWVELCQKTIQCTYLVRVFGAELEIQTWDFFFFSFDWPVFMEHLLCDRCYARHVC